MAPVPLRDPEWTQAAAICPACGYSLAGLEPPIPCPECGLEYSGRQFVVYGVPSARSVMSRSRIAMIVLVSVVGMFVPQVIAMTWMFVSGVVASIVLIGSVAVVVAMVVTAPRSQGGRSRFVFVAGGVNVMPLQVDPTAAVGPKSGFIKFQGNERVRLKRASAVWCKLTIERADGQAVFNAGIRCPKNVTERLLTTVDELIRGRPAGTGEAPLTS